MTSRKIANRLLLVALGFFALGILLLLIIPFIQSGHRLEPVSDEDQGSVILLGGAALFVWGIGGIVLVTGLAWYLTHYEQR